MMILWLFAAAFAVLPAFAQTTSVEAPAARGCLQQQHALRDFHVLYRLK
jgi:hypothetical protein